MAGRNMFVTATVILMTMTTGTVSLRGDGDEVIEPQAEPGNAEPGVVSETVVPDDLRTPSPTEARERAALLHEFVHETLLAVHHHYYREDEGMLLPATTMRGVFEKYAKSRKVQLRWLAVDAEPMNVEHAAKDDFEQAAVKALKSGEPFFESVAADEYRYAGSIVLTSECLKCHVPNRTSVRNRMAGIAIRMPRTAAGEKPTAVNDVPAR